VRVVITRRSTAQVVTVTTNSVGAYNSGALIPGDYSVQLSVAGFRMVSSSATVLVGNVATMNGTFGEGFSSTQG